MIGDKIKVIVILIAHCEKMTIELQIYFNLKESDAKYSHKILSISFLENRVKLTFTLKIRIFRIF